MPDAEHNLTAADMVALEGVLDRLVPAQDDMPGAGGLGLADRVDELSRDNPIWRRGLLIVMDAVSLDPRARSAGGWMALDADEQAAALTEIETNLPEHFGNLVKLVYATYYSDERVHRRIGWRSGAPQPSGWQMPPFDESVMETARKRAPFWREAPE